MTGLTNFHSTFWRDSRGLALCELELDFDCH